MDPTQIKLAKGMTLYKHKGFMLYTISALSKSKGTVELHKIFSDTSEQPIKTQDLIHAIQTKKFKIIPPSEVEKKLKELEIKTKTRKKQIEAVYARREKQIQHFRQHFNLYLYNESHPEEK